MKNIVFPLIFIIVCNCTSWKRSIEFGTDRNTIIRIAISDFIHTSPLYEDDDVFEVSTKDLKEIIGVSIYAYPNAILISKENETYSYSGLPDDFLEVNGKLFYWDNSSDSINIDLINLLEKYNKLDTMIRNEFIPKQVIDHTIKAQHYYFCISNPKMYRKKRTTLALGMYQYPSPRCN